MSLPALLSRPFSGFSSFRLHKPSDFEHPNINEPLPSTVLRLKSTMYTAHSITIQTMTRMPKSWSPIEDETSEAVSSTTKWLTAPTIVLLIIVIITAFCNSLYATTFSLIFAQDFGISSTVGGYLDAAANIFSFIVLSLFLKYSTKSALLQYPFDILSIAIVFVIGHILFFLFYAEWIAYSVHWIIRRMTIVMMGLQMVSRLYLCPPAAFNKVTSIAGLLRTTGFLSGSTLGPILFTVNHRLSFVVMAVMNIILFIVVSTVYVYRNRKLSAMEFDDETKGQYLLMERAMNHKLESDEAKERERKVISETKRMLRRVTATDISRVTT